MGKLPRTIGLFGWEVELTLGGVKPYDADPALNGCVNHVRNSDLGVSADPPTLLERTELVSD